MSTYADDLDSAFEAIGRKYYPGSSRPLAPRPGTRLHTKASWEADDWAAKPRKGVVNGEEINFYTVGQLAQALGRKAVTIRKWEREGIIPKPTYQAPGRDGDVRGRRRLYTREQVEGIVRIAREEGILVSHKKPIKDTRFTERVLDLFRELNER